MRRIVLALAVSLPATAQNTVRWNDVVASLDETPPAVQVWLDQRRSDYGQPVRVGFRVEEDAFVVVARVDNDGRLTVLFPASSTRASAVKGGEDNYIRSSRFGTGVTFFATERPGSSGFVFALASRSPMDLSRLRVRDFSSWVTGRAVGEPVSRYSGDPYRVVQRFARGVMFSEWTEFDFDVEFYSVDRPQFASTSAYSNCQYSGFAGLFGLRSGSSRRASMFDEYGYGSALWTGNDCLYDLQCLVPFLGNGFGQWYYPISGRCGQRQQLATNSPDPSQPPVPPIEIEVNPWAADSIQRPNVNVQLADKPNGPHIMTERPAPLSSGWTDREDLSFSIPGRALRGLRSADRVDAGSSKGAGPSGPMPMPARPTPEMVNPGTIDWVSPPRSFDGPRSNGEGERLPTRFNRQDVADRNNGVRSGSGRFDGGSPPPRTGSPMFDREPGRNSPVYPMPGHGGSGGFGGGSSIYTPPGEGRPSTPSGITVTGGSGSAITGSGGSTSPPATSTPPASSGAAATGEKKPS